MVLYRKEMIVILNSFLSLLLLLLLFFMLVCLVFEFQVTFKIY